MRRVVHLALGLQDRMVGTATWTDRIRPNLAPSHGENRDDESGDGPRTKPLRLSTIQTEVRQLAQIFDVRAKGEALAADLQRRLEQVRADNAARDPKEISIASWFANTESPYVAGCCGSSGIISRAAGVRNVFADTQDEFPRVSWETMLDRDPTVLVLGDPQRRSQTGDKLADKMRFLETDPVTKRLTAVRKKRYVILNGADMNPSIRTVDGAEKVSAGIRRLGLVR